MDKIEAILGGDVPVYEADESRLMHRAQLERLVREAEGVLSPEEWSNLLRRFRVYHPNRKLFFARPEVFSQVPDTVDLTDLPCPARPQFAAEPLLGQRAI